MRVGGWMIVIILFIYLCQRLFYINQSRYMLYTLCRSKKKNGEDQELECWEIIISFTRTIFTKYWPSSSFHSLPYIYQILLQYMYIRRPNKHTSLICPNLGHTKHTFLPCRFSEIKLAIFQFTEKQTRHRPIRVHQTTRLLIPVLKTIISHTTAHIFFMIF